jgi:predicted ATPase
MKEGVKLMIYDNLKFQSYPFKYNLIFKSRITIVGGDSGTGKTFLYNLLEVLKKNPEYKNIVTYNYKSDDIEDSIFKQHNKFIIVDNADIILTDKCKRFINENRDNQYMIFGRVFEGLMLNRNSHVQLVEESKNSFVLKGEYFLC